MKKRRRKCIMTTVLRNYAITVSIVLLCAAVPVEGAYIVGQGDIAFTPLEPVNGYGAVVKLIDIYLEESKPFSPLIGAVGFDSYLADIDYKFQFGLIPVSQYTGSSADWDKTLAIEVVYTSGIAGKAYTRVNGIADTNNAVTITDLLGGVDSAVTITDLLGGVDSLVISTQDGDLNANGYVRGSLGYPDSPTDPQAYNPSDWQGEAYLIAQVLDPNESGYSITGSGFIAPVPEPSTLALLALGGLALLRRRRRRV